MKIIIYKSFNLYIRFSPSGDRMPVTGIFNEIIYIV